MNVLGKNARAFLAFLLVLLSLFSWPTSTARASESRGCPKEIIDWVARADAEHPANLRAMECFPGHVRLRLDIVDSSSLDVDIAFPASRSFRSIGHLGVSPMLEVPDFKAVPAPQRDAFELLCAWLEKHEMEVTRANVMPIPVLRNIQPVPDSLFGNLWSRYAWASLAGVIALVAIGSARRVRTTESGRRDWWVFGGLFFASFLMRLLFGAFGPHHVNGQGPSWILAANLDPTRLTGYGPGYYELFSLLCEAFPRWQDTAIFTANMFFSALAAPLLFALACQVKLDTGRAALAGAVIAVDAVSIRFGATEAYFTPIITLSLGAAIFLVWSADRLQKGHRIHGFLLAMLGALLTVQTARIHPIAWGPLTLGPVFILASGVSNSKQWPRRLGVTSAIVVLILVSLIITSGRVILSVVWNVNRYLNAHTGVDTVIHFAREHVLHFAVLGFILLRVVKPRWLLLPAIVSCVGLMATRNVYTQSAIWVASYDRLWLAPPLLALASMVPDALFRSWRTRSVLGAAIALFFVSGWSTMHERTTEHDEYLFFRDAFATLPNGCRVIHVSRVEKRIVTLPEYAISSLANGSNSIVEVSSPADVRSLLRPGVCLRYARTSLCTSAEGRPVCAAIENEMHLVPLFHQDFPAKPSHVTSTYDQDTVRVGLFDVQTPSNSF